MRQQMEQAIAAEGSTEGMLECRKEVFEILRVSAPYHSSVGLLTLCECVWVWALGCHVSLLNYDLLGKQSHAS